LIRGESCAALIMSLTYAALTIQTGRNRRKAHGTTVGKERK